MERRENFIVILGAGESGVGAALLAKKKGLPVFVSDNGIIPEGFKNVLVAGQIDFEEGKHSEEKILEAFEVIKSPGIPDEAGIIKKIKAQNIPVISEIEFASRYTKSKIVGITGSNGKSTTTSLVNHVFTKAGLNVGMAGNIGKSFAGMLATEEEHDVYVLELSSFQLDGIEKFHCDVAVLLNITPDHLDRYDYELKNYVDSKFRITKNQTDKDVFIYCADDEITMQNFSRFTISSKLLPVSIKKKPAEDGGWLDHENIQITYHKTHFIMQSNQLSISGKHNVYNSLAAGIIARIFDISDETLREGLSDFRTLEHRLEYVAKVKGVEFINDSKATNVNSTWYALESMTNPVILILGGVDKGNDYSVLADLVKKKVKAIVCLGADNTKIHTELSRYVDVIVNTDNMTDSVKSSLSLADKGDVVLLSPACASFDLFKNYEDRGKQFKQAVSML